MGWASGAGGLTLSREMQEPSWPEVKRARGLVGGTVLWPLRGEAWAENASTFRAPGPGLPSGRCHLETARWMCIQAFPAGDAAASLQQGVEGGWAAPSHLLTGRSR